MSGGAAWIGLSSDTTYQFFPANAFPEPPHIKSYLIIIKNPKASLSKQIFLQHKGTDVMKAVTTGTTS